MTTFGRKPTKKVLAGVMVLTPASTFFVGFLPNVVMGSFLPVPSIAVTVVTIPTRRAFVVLRPCAPVIAGFLPSVMAFSVLIPAIAVTVFLVPKLSLYWAVYIRGTPDPRLWVPLGIRDQKCFRVLCLDSPTGGLSEVQGTPDPNLWVPSGGPRLRTCPVTHLTQHLVLKRAAVGRPQTQKNFTNACPRPGLAR